MVMLGKAQTFFELLFSQLFQSWNSPEKNVKKIAPSKNLSNLQYSLQGFRTAFPCTDISKIPLLPLSESLPHLKFTRLHAGFWSCLLQSQRAPLALCLPT